MDVYSQRALVHQVKQTKTYQDYQMAFEATTGLPLSLCPARSESPAFRGKAREAPICAVMTKSEITCRACLEVQNRLEREAQCEAKTLVCFAGLCETAVPIRVGDRVIAFLRTGQALLQPEGAGNFHRLIELTQQWNMNVDHRIIEEVYSQLPYMTSQKYQGVIKLLLIFSEQLSALGNDFLLAPKADDFFYIRRVKTYIEERYTCNITLNEIAALINVSRPYICRIFKKSTGMTFIEYLSMLRVENAKKLLKKDRFRICDIAFEVGFNSLSQFNRAFFRYTGQKPSQYRKNMIKIKPDKK